MCCYWNNTPPQDEIHPQLKLVVVFVYELDKDEGTSSIHPLPIEIASLPDLELDSLLPHLLVIALIFSVAWRRLSIFTFFFYYLFNESNNYIYKWDKGKFSVYLPLLRLRE